MALRHPGDGCFFPSLPHETPWGQENHRAGARGPRHDEGAVAANVPGIISEFNGATSCATCHVAITPKWRSIGGKPGDLANKGQEINKVPRHDSPLLSCQLANSPALDGIILHLPGN